MKIYPYKLGSKSAKALAEALGIKRVRKEGPAIRTDTLINWGASAIHRVVVIEGGYYLNHPVAVADAANKLQSFKTWDKGVSTPDWTESAVEASRWLAEGFTVMCRTVLNGHSGEGIVLATNREELVAAPLYTKYIKKREEYRLHVFRGAIIFQQRKARKLDVKDEDVNWKVRNLAGGFIFANKDVIVPEAAHKEAINAVGLLGLDFGAVDIILGNDGKFYVLEVNTACGLEGSTLDAYVKAFKELE